MAMFAFGILLNLWTLQVLGIKGMYNGDSFGWILFDEPVKHGPFQFFEDPQYAGTTFAAVGSALYYQSRIGLWLAGAMYVVFQLSTTYIETPHMTRIYSNRQKSKLYDTKKASKGKSVAASPPRSTRPRSRSTKK